MASAQENLARFQEISNRGLQDQLAPDKRARFDEALSRGLFTQQAQAIEQPTEIQPMGFDDIGPGGQIGGVPSVHPRQDERSLIPAAFQPQAAIASAAIAEPIAGIAGLARSILPGEPGVGAETVGQVREALTFKPDDPAPLQRLGEVLEPVTSAIQATEDFLGDTTLKITGSPALATAAATLPTAIVEAIGGIGLLKRSGGKLTKSGNEALATTSKQVDKALVESAPDIDTLKEVSRGVYKELDDLGVTVKTEAFNSMLKTAVRRAKREGVDEVLTPKSQRVVDLFGKDISERKIRTVSDLERMRKRAQQAASSPDLDDARVGTTIIDEIDSFMDNVAPNAFSGDLKGKNIGSRFKAARKLWGRARRAELIQLAMERAGRQATGFENGIRTQLRQILNNKKQSRYFTKDELAAMDDVVKGSNEQNILKLVGRLGFSEGQATNILGGLASTAIFGPGATVAGQISRKLAQRSTKNAAVLSDAIVKAGANGRKITEAYLRLTPKNKRSASELSELFLDSGADIDALLKSGNKAAKEAAELAKGRKAFLTGAAISGVATSEE
jgi:hypothetical protein